MKIYTVNASVAGKLRELAENPTTVAAVDVGATADQPGAVAWSSAATSMAQVGTRTFALLPQAPAGALTGLVKPAGVPPADAYGELKVLVRDVGLPIIKTVWPDASQIVTGVQLMWAGLEFWDELKGEDSTTEQQLISGVRLASSAAGLLLSLQQAPSLAVNTNLIAGFVIAGADKVYALRADATN